MTEREKLHWRDDKLVAKRDRGRERRTQKQRLSSDVFLPLYVRVVCVQFSDAEVELHGLVKYTFFPL